MYSSFAGSLQLFEETQCIASLRKYCLNLDPPPFHSVGQVWGDLSD